MILKLTKMEKSGERPTPQEHGDTDIKNSEKESLKVKKRNAHLYKMLFKKGNVKNKTPAAESSSHKKQRLCSGDQSAINDKIESGSSECKFIEYWVPAHLSSMQIEQYCAILTSNSDTLSALPRKSSLNDIITQIQKCCDHPYLADPTLRKSAKEASLTDDPLAADINVSGKLHVFDKLLLEIKQCGLKALVLFQSAVNSEKISTGHILDDVVHQRFGGNSYVYMPGEKKECLETFNNAESERFVCLCDYRACHSSIRLSRVDVVIIFNSDRNPSNDIKALKKITIDSPCERVNVFRLYSPFTVEEKALILSKEGTVVDSYISSTVCHQLLAWGAPYLFSKVRSTGSGPQSFLDDLLHELSSLVRNTNVKAGPTDRSIISNAQMQNGAYSECIKLFGETESHKKESASAVEYLVANSPSDYWSNLVTGPEKSRKKLCRRVRKPNENCIEGENAAVTPSFVRSKKRSKRKYLKNVGRKPAACENATPESISDSIALNPGTNGGQQSQPEQPPPQTLENEVGTNGGQQSQPEQPPSRTLEKVGTNGGQQSQPEQPPPHSLEKVGTNGGQQSQPEQPPPHSLEKGGTNVGQQSQPEQPQPHTLEKEVERVRKEREQITKSHQEKESKLLAEREKEISEVRKRYGGLIHDSKTRSKNEDILLASYQRLVNANKLLAEILAQNLQATPALKETSPLNVLTIPATAPRKSARAERERFPAPHLRSNPSLFPSLHNRLSSGELSSLEQLPTPTVSTT